MMILVILMHAALALIFPIGRAVVQICGPAFFTGSRMLVGGVVLLIYQWGWDDQSKRLYYRALWLIVAFALTAIFITNVCEYWALQFLPAAKTAFFYSLSPFAAAIFSYFFFHEKMTFTKFLGMGIGFLGFSYMIIRTEPGELPPEGVPLISIAEIVAVIGAITSALGWIIMRKKIIRKKCTPLEVLTYGMILGSIPCFVTSWFIENWAPIPIVDIQQNGIYVLGYLIVSVIFCSLIGYLLYIHLLKQYTVTLLSFVGFIEPLCSAVYSWVWLGEPITAHFLIAAAVVFVGLYIFYMEELKQGYVVHPVSK